MVEGVPHRRKTDFDVPLISVLGGTELFREGLVRVLRKEGFADVRAFATVAAMRDLLEQRQVILADPSAGEPMVDFCRTLKAAFQQARIVLLSASYDTDELKDAFAAGADGYLVTTMSCDQLAGALRLIALGVKFPPAPLVEALASLPASDQAQLTSEATNAVLSARELEIVLCLVEGLPNKLISRRLSISDATVKVHVKAVLRKLNLFNRTQVATWALRSGLVSPHDGGAPSRNGKATD